MILHPGSRIPLHYSATAWKARKSWSCRPYIPTNYIRDAAGYRRGGS